MPKFTPEERALLEPYVTSADHDIFVVKNIPGIVGAVFARYSRARGGFRETFLKEFLKEGVLDPVRAKDLLERVLIGFGDDSVGELEGTYVSFENVSILASKEIEERRIGGSPIEQSTRYVFYDMPGEDGRFRYHRPQEIMSSPHAARYVETMDAIFSTYVALIEPMQEFYKRLKPIDEAEYDVVGDGVKRRLTDLADEKQAKSFRTTYAMDIRTKTCDTLRCILPLATQTHVGVFGNGRFFQYALSHCFTSDLPEANDIARRAQLELEKIIPAYVKRAKRQEYQAANRERMFTLAGGMLDGVAPEPQERTALVDRTDEFLARRIAERPGDAAWLAECLQSADDDLAIACMLYPYAWHPLAQLQRFVRDLPEERRRKIIAAYVGDRRTRRDRPGRAFESGYPYTFDLCTDFGVYKDLMRHRMCTQLRQRFTPSLGFNMPPDLVAAGFEKNIREVIDRASALHTALEKDFPVQAQYAALHGSLVRWVLGINDRALHHLVELRSTPQGHPAYRKVAQEMHAAAAARSSWRGEVMKFVDYGDYAWARGDSEARQRVKEAALDQKGGATTGTQRGRFFVIDGTTNGAGKTTQAKDLVSRLLREGHAAEYIRFPQYGKPSAAKVERYLAGDFGPADSVDAWTVTKYYAEDRLDAAPQIRAALENGVHVVADRFVSSNMAHQGGKIGDPERRREFLRRNDTYEYGELGIPRPDLTIILRVPVEVGILRVAEAGGAKNAHERDERHLRNAAEAYMDMVNLFPGFQVIECMENGAQLPPERIHDQVWERIRPLL